LTSKPCRWPLSRLIPHVIFISDRNARRGRKGTVRKFGTQRRMTSCELSSGGGAATAQPISRYSRSLGGTRTIHSPNAFHQRHRIVELPTAQNHQEPRPLPKRRVRSQTAVAGNLHRRRQTGREREKQRGRPPNQRTAQSRLIEGRLETSTRPTDHRLPQPSTHLHSGSNACDGRCYSGRRNAHRDSAHPLRSGPAHFRRPLQRSR
jgi:hypothetical protein